MIQVAVIGAGHWGPNLIRAFHNRRTSEVRWVVDRDQVRRSHVAAHYPSVWVSADCDEALADEQVDAVVVATPTSTHYQFVKAALECDKHVFVEKPLTASSQTAEELCQLADSRGLVLMVGHVFLYNAAVQRVRELITAECLGRLYYLAMVRTNLGPIRMDVNAAWDLAAHDVSIANYWLENEPLSVSAVGGTWINAGIEDAVFATLRYPSDVLVTLHASWLNPRKAREITVVGDRQMLTFDDMNPAEPIRIYDHGVTEERRTITFIDSYAEFRASVRHGDITIPRVVVDEPLTAECGHFLECVDYGKEPLTNAWSGLSVVRTLEAIQRSLRNRGVEEPVRAA